MSKNKYIRNDFFVTPIFKFKNENLAKKLNEFILEKDINGIESNIANELKHNLNESNFNFFSAKDTIINESKNLNILRISIETGSGEFFEPARKLFISCNFQPCAPFAHYKEDVNSLYFTKLISND
mgnify:CR=1 FL=1